MIKDASVASSSDPRFKKTLRVSYLDGVFAAGMAGFTQDYFTPFLLLLGGSAQHVGILNALQNLCASLLQFKSPDLTVRMKSRRKVFNTFVFFQALMLLPMAVSAFLCAVSPTFFILLVILFASFGALATPAWSSLMSDLIAVDKRGAYFGWRNKTLGLITVACTFLAGFILQHMAKVDLMFRFGIIFGLAFIFRLVSWNYLTRMHEPPLSHNKEDQFTLFKFLARFKESNFAKFVLFVAMLNFSVNLASPFFPVLMLKDFSFSYMLYAVITVTATLTLCLMMARWGRHADRVGNLKVMKLTAPMIAFVPLLWIFNHHPLFLFFAQIFSGFAWAGFNLCASNFIFDCVTPEKRTRCVAYFNVFSGLALCFGSLLGGFLLQRLPPLFGYKILTLLLISSLLRFLVVFLFPVKLKEVKPVEKITNRGLFLSMLGIRPFVAIR